MTISSINSFSICARCGAVYRGYHSCISESPSTTITRCTRHQTFYWGVSCYLCDEEARRLSRDVINVLEARIADHDSELSALRRQIIELRQIVLDVQRAHNRSVRP